MTHHAVVAAISIGIDPVAFRLGHLDIRWYGIMYVVAISLGARVALRFVNAFRADAEVLWSIFPWAIVAGLVGGRLYYVLQNRQLYYLQHPQHVLAFWEGGMAFFGAIIAVSATMIWVARRQHTSIWPLLDIAAIFAAVGQPIGRIGNIVNGDIVGYATTLPWGTAYTNPSTLAPKLNVPYQPAAAYEILANLLLIVALWLILRRWRAPGLAAGLYLTGYSVTQFVVFFWRANSVTLLGLKQAQLTAIVTFAVSLAFLWWVWPSRLKSGPLNQRS
jgi:phosphatidylglycerol:prolipoprotein diacylglycerol transferase